MASSGVHTADAAFKAIRNFKLDMETLGLEVVAIIVPEETIMALVSHRSSQRLAHRPTPNGKDLPAIDSIEYEGLLILNNDVAEGEEF